jgi:DNA-binding response OmpR family regulator
MHALIIEDEGVIAALIEFELRQLGYETCDVVSSEQMAIRAAEHRCPDLITVEDRLRDGSGINAVQTICRHVAIPVVYITTVPADTHGRVPEGATVLGKPWLCQDLANAVLKAVSSAPVRLVPLHERVD